MHGRVIVDNTYEFQYHNKKRKNNAKTNVGVGVFFCGNYSVFDLFFANLSFFLSFEFFLEKKEEELKRNMQKEQ